MKLVIPIFLMLILLSCNDRNLKKVGEEELINMIVENRMPDPENNEY